MVKNCRIAKTTFYESGGNNKSFLNKNGY